MKLYEWVRLMLETAILHSSILLTVTGVSKCVSIEARGVVGFMPSLLGLGGALAFDAPVYVEVCGLGSVAAVEDLDVRIVGRGLYYSSRGLDRELVKYTIGAYKGDNDHNSIISTDSGFCMNCVLVYTSIHGASIFIDNYRFPLSDLEGYWAVVIKLKKPFKHALNRIVENMVMNQDKYRELLLETIDDPLTGLHKIGTYTASILGKRAVSLVESLERKGAIAALLDYTGRAALAITEDAVNASLLSASVRNLGDRLEAEVSA